MIATEVVLGAGSWWWPLVRCPYCGAIPGDSGRCVACARRYERAGNVIEWIPAAEQSARVSWANRLATLAAPLRSPLLPFRYLTRYRVEGYYHRTLHDPQLARAWAGQYLRDLPLPASATVLDFGCGRGRHVGMLQQLGHCVLGQELRPNVWWHRLPAAGFQTVSDGRRLPWRDAGFDLVLEVGVLHYLETEVAASHASEIARVLKPGGTWVLLEANAAGAGAGYVRKQIGRLHSIAQVRQWTAASGFAEIDAWYEGYYAPILPSLVDYARKQLSPRPLDLADYQSALARRTPAERRAVWCLRVRKPLSSPS